MALGRGNVRSQGRGQGSEAIWRIASGMRNLLSVALLTSALLTNQAGAATPYPRFIDGRAVAKIDGVVSTLSIKAKDAGTIGDEGSATLRTRGGEDLNLDMDCVNVLSVTSALASGVGGDGITTYLVVVEDGGVGKDRYSVAQNPVARAVCDAGVVPPLPEPAAIRRGDLLIRSGA